MPVTFTVKFPLYSAWFAPLIVTIWLLEYPCELSTHVAVVPDPVKLPDETLLLTTAFVIEFIEILFWIGGSIVITGGVIYPRPPSVITIFITLLLIANLCILFF